MKVMFSLIVTVVVAAVLGASTALANTNPDWFERAAAKAQQDAPAPYVDAFERAAVAPATSPDWFERAAARAERGASATPYVDAFERATIASPATARTQDVITRSESETGSGIEWAQIGVALGLGLFLGLGLVLALRHRPRPVA